MYRAWQAAAAREAALDRSQQSEAASSQRQRTHRAHCKQNVLTKDFTRSTHRTQTTRVKLHASISFALRAMLALRLAGNSGVTSHRQPRQCRGAKGPKTAKGAQSDPNYAPRPLLDCVPVFHKIITPAYLLNLSEDGRYLSFRNVCREGGGQNNSYATDWKPRLRPCSQQAPPAGSEVQPGPGR